jgi:hypothetical protein
VRLPITPALPIDVAATAPNSVPEPAERQADPARPAADPLGA